MELKLKKPLVFVDLETTGKDPKEDRIVEISLVKISVDGEKSSFESKVNPGIKINPAATAVHGITDEQAADEVSFPFIAKYVIEFIEGCDMAGYSSNAFDIPILYRELKRSGIRWNWKETNFIDVGNIFKIMESRTLAAAYRYYCKKELINAHSSTADVEATIEILQEQIKLYSDHKEFKQLNSVGKIAFFSNYNKEMVDITGNFTKNDDGQMIFNFGKHKGEICRDHNNYLYWMLKDASFDEDVKAIVKNLLFGAGNTNEKLKNLKKKKGYTL
jgi:DNA polymerase-3 subunit epsilon